MLRWLKKNLPNKDNLSHQSSLHAFRHYLNYSYIWDFNSSSVARGTAIGLFVAFIPLPLQMLLAASLAFIFRANLPLAVALTWITNPFTFIPINYFIYWVGRKILREPILQNAVPNFSWQFDNLAQFWSDLMIQVSQLGKAYFLGLPVVAFTASAIGYFAVKLIWYYTITLPQKKNKTK